MKHLFSFIFCLFALAALSTSARAQAVSSAAFGSTVAVYSGHTTVRERVDAGVNERIELWNRTWIVSPSGQVYSNTDHWGFNAPDGYAATTITFNETGRWSYWASDGGSIDNFVYGDSASDWYIWPHNPPNGVGYGGWGRRLTSYIDIGTANNAPTITWTATPGTVGSGQSYSVTAHGHDADGNLTQVNIWKNGVGFAFAGGGNGTDGDSGNSTSDGGPTTITFTANAVDSDGATSATISQTVTITAANSAPTIAWTATPGSVASGQSYTVTAHGHDVDGNLTQVNIWKNGVGFAFAGGGNGTDGDSGNSTSDIGPATITFTANAVDSNGVSSGTISQTVSIGAPPSVSASISVSPSSATAPGSVTVTWSSANATAVSVAGTGLASSSASGSQAVGGLSTGSHTFTITAQGPGGPVTQAATVTVNPPANTAPTITWTSTPGTVASGQSYTISAHGHDADGNLTEVNIWKSGSAFAFAGGGNGTDGDSGNSSTDTGPQSVTYTADAVDSNGARSGTISQSVTINAPPTVSASISASPATGTAPGSTTISWSSANATAVSVSGNGLTSSATSGSQAVSGLPVGTHTYTVIAQGAGGPVTQSATFTVGPPANTLPTISWNTTPGTIASGQSYTISAHGHDADGNLTEVNIWKNGSAFAFAGGGNGTDGDSGNSSADTGPQSVTYTADAVDSNGARSGTISQNVTINAPPTVSASISASPATGTAPASTTISWSSANATAVSVSGNGLTSSATSGSQTVSGLPVGTHTYTVTAQGAGGPVTQSATFTVGPPANTPPTISWNTTPGTVASGQSYTVSAHGHDPDGNLTEVNVWRNGVAYAFAGGGNGTDGDSGNPSTDTGPLTVTYTADAVDSNGARSGTISQTVTISAPAAVAASISASPTAATAPGSTTITWSSVNATAVSVSGNGLTSSAASGSQAVSGLPAGSHTYTITAQGPGGPVTQSVTITVTAAAAVSASISATPSSAAAPAAATITWSSANATAVAVSGPGLSSAVTAGSQSVSGLSAGVHTYTITAQGPNGPASDTATVTVSAAPNSAPTVAWNTTPGTVASGQSYTVSAHGHDPDGNLTNVNVWRNGVAYAFAGGGNGTDNDSGNPSTDSGPLTVVYTAQAMDAAGLSSATISQTVTVTAPPAVSGSISASPTATTAPGSATLTWSTANAISVSVSGSGLNSTASSGSQTVSGLAAGSYTYTLTAHGPGGPVTQTATVTVTGGPNVSGSINVSPGSMAWGGTATVTWTTANATTVRVAGYGITGTPYENSANLTVNVGGLNPGQTTWTLIAEGPGGPITRTATISVTTSDGLYGSLTASPTVIYSNQSSTLNWTTTGTGFRWVHGYQPGLNGVNVYPAAVTGSSTVSGLSPGNYRFVIEYGPGSSTTRMSFADLTVLGVNRTVMTSTAPVGAGSVTGAGIYMEGTSATLVAVPDATHVFAGWTGDLTSSANPVVFTVGAQNYNVVANFALRTFAVTAVASPVGAGTITGGGSYPMGNVATLTATPDATHTFTGWSGDLSSAANPLSFTVTSATNLIANFAPTSFSLTTTAVSGGTVTPGGTYAAGTVVTVAATPDTTHRFTGWTGDASGLATSVAVTMDRAKMVQANFAAKAAQTITFDPPGDHGLASPPFTLVANATSGLPVSFSLLSGPATLTGNSVEVTGAGPVTIQASQPGDAFFLPAAPVNQSFNVIAAATLKYRGQSRTLLRDATTREAPPFVLEKP